MKKIKKLGFYLAIAATLGFSGCGGGGDDSIPASGVTNTGTFIDAPVQGLKYFTLTQSGFTNQNGDFQYKSGENITFKLGTLTLGTVLADTTITPLALAGDTSLGSVSTKAKNIAMLLQNFDLNRSNTARIVISSALSDHNFSEIDLNSSSLEASLSALLADGNIAQNIDQTDNTVISQTAATAIMIDYIKGYIAGTYTGKLSVLENYIEGRSCYGQDNYSLNIVSTGDNFNIISPLGINGQTGNVTHTTSSLESSTLDFVYAESPINDYALKIENIKFDGKTLRGFYYLKNVSLGTICKGEYSLSREP